VGIGALLAMAKRARVTGEPVGAVPDIEPAGA
jgi:hypothetical protein